MSIKHLYQSGRPVVSFEIFPPKKDNAIDSIYDVLGQMTALSPDFISVTYGAGGSGNDNRTVELASFIQNCYGIESLAHLTCIGTPHAKIHQLLTHMHSEGIRNILALRGDSESSSHPSDPHSSFSPSETAGYRYAKDLICDIRRWEDFCIGAACYPEGHIDCDNMRLDIDYLHRKQDAGADFLITQLFFDNEIFFRFLKMIRARGVTLPVSAGVMPILGQAQIQRMIFMCGASLPAGIVKLLHKYKHSPQDLRKAGIEHAALQIEDLLRQGVDGVHIYTMNKPDIAASCMKHIGRVP